jgi:DNA repair protein RadD
VILRPYQREAVDAALLKLETGNPLIIAPTGAGKTIMLSSLIGEVAPRLGNGITMVLQHRTELVKQNSEKFLKVNKGAPIGYFTGKSRLGLGSAKTIFATVQTIGKQSFRDHWKLPIDLLAIDECHHTGANSYGETVEFLEARNPALRVAGFTATPEGGAGLGDVYDETTYNIEIDTLIEDGYLVQPDSWMIDIGLNEPIAELGEQRNRISDAAYNRKLADIYKPKLDQVVKTWEERADDRHTVVFATTIEQGKEVAQTFRDRGHSAMAISSKMSQADIRHYVDAFARGEFHVLVNVAILTEGYDCPPIDCVVLMRSCSSHPTMVQMVGRGLRPVDPKEYPWSKKKDCLVLDFGDTIRTHGTLGVDSNVKAIKDQKEAEDILGQDIEIVRCPSCDKLVTPKGYECPECGELLMEVIEGPAGKMPDFKRELKNFKMEHAKLTRFSPFRWIDIQPWVKDAKGETMISTGIDSWVVMVGADSDWLGIGGGSSEPTRVISRGKSRVVFAQANNFMSEIETSDSAKKSRSWMRLEPSNKQVQMLKGYKAHNYQETVHGMTRHDASCLITFFKNQHRIDRAISEEEFHNA